MSEYDKEISEYKTVEGFCNLDKDTELPVCMDSIIWDEETEYRKKKSAICSCVVEEYLQTVSEKTPKCLQCKVNLTDCQIMLEGKDSLCDDCQASNYTFTNNVKQKINQQIGECPICYEEKILSRFCKNNHFFCDVCINGKYEMYKVTEEDKPIFPYGEEIKHKYMKFMNEGKYLTDDNLIDVDQNYKQKLKKKDLHSDFNSDVYIESEEPEYFGKVFNRNYDINDKNLDGFSFKVFIQDSEENLCDSDIWQNNMIDNYLFRILDRKDKKEGTIKKTLKECLLNCPMCRKYFYS